MALHIVNCEGVVVEGADGSFTLSDATEVAIRDGVASYIGDARASVDLADATRLDANGLVAVPALIDGHVHPTVGGVSVVPPAPDWIDTYLGAGVTQCVSAGELTMPGFRQATLDPEFVTALATTAAKLFAGYPSPMRVHAGTLLAVPGLTRRQLAEVQAAGGRCLKFIYYPFDGEWEEEAGRYVTWAHELGLVVKMHAGGTSFQGHSVAATAEIVRRLRPDVLAHVNGGPIPMNDADVMSLLDETDAAMEVILGGNLRLLGRIASRLTERGELRRLVVGTDTPGGNGLMPRGVMQVAAAICSLGGVDAWSAWRSASAGVADAHGIRGGRIAERVPADILLVGPVSGSACGSVAEALESGEVVGVGAVIREGRVVQLPGAYLPPPARLPQLVDAGTRAGRRSAW